MCDTVHSALEYAKGLGAHSNYSSEQTPTSAEADNAVMTASNPLQRKASPTPALPVAFRVQKYLGALRYPAQKARIVDYARCRGVEQDSPLLQALLALPEGEYISPVSLARELTTEANAKVLRSVESSHDDAPKHGGL